MSLPSLLGEACTALSRLGPMQGAQAFRERANSALREAASLSGSKMGIACLVDAKGVVDLAGVEGWKVLHNTAPAESVIPHHFWVLVTTHIGAHAESTHANVRALLKLRQPGRVVVVAAQANAAVERATAVLREIKDDLDVRVCIKEDPPRAKDLLPAWRLELGPAAASRWIGAFVRCEASNLTDLRRTLRASSDHVRAYSPLLQEERRSLGRMSETLRARHVAAQVRLSLESFEFDWSTVLSGASEGPSPRKASPKRAPGGKGYPGSWDTDREDRGSGTGAPAEGSPAPKRSSATVTQPLARSLEQQVKRVLAERIHDAYRNGIGMHQDIAVVESRRVHGTERTLLLQAFREAGLSGPPETTFDPAPDWPLNEKVVEDLVKKALRERPLDAKAMTSLLAMARQNPLGRAVIPIAARLRLDSWARGVAELVLTSAQRKGAAFLDACDTWARKSAAGVRHDEGEVAEAAARLDEGRQACEHLVRHVEREPDE